MEQTWFITGSSRAWVAPSPGPPSTPAISSPPPPARPAQLDDLVAQFGERIHTIGLDVTDAQAARSAIADARRHFGRLDVIVNNAGYANVSPIETTDDEDFRAQFETNFWGVYHVSKAAIPVLREQGGGLVMQISSVGGRVGGSPGIASYQAAKFAIDGFSRVLRAETAPFGVKVMVVEPSGFRTDWAGSSMTVHDIPEAYASTVGAMNTPRPAKHRRTRGRPGTRRRHPCSDRQTARHPGPPAPRGERGRRLHSPRRATPRRRPQMERREPLRRLQRALPERAPSRHAEVDRSESFRPASQLRRTFGFGSDDDRRQAAAVTIDV